MKKLVLDTVYKYIFAVFFLIVLYLGLSNEPGMGNNFHFLIGNFYYVLLVFLAGKAMVGFFVEKKEWKELLDLRLNYIWVFSFSLLNLMILFSMKGVELGEYIDLALLKLNSGVLFTAFFSKIYGYTGKIGMYVIFIPLFIFSSLVVFGKIIGYMVRFFIKFKKSDFLKNYRANLIESRIKRREKKLNYELNKAQKMKKKKFEKLSKEIDQEEIRPKFNDILEKEDHEEYMEEEKISFDVETELESRKEALDESYELQESQAVYEELSEEEADEFFGEREEIEEDPSEEIEDYENSSLEQEKLEFEEIVEEDIEEETETFENMVEANKEKFYEEKFEEDEFQQEHFEESSIRFEDEELVEENKGEPKEKGTFLLFHLFGVKEKDEKKEKARLLRKKRKDEEKQKKQEMKDKRKRLREELRSRNLKITLPEEETYDNAIDYDYEDSFAENTENQPKGFSEDDLKNIDYSEISEGLELELSVVQEGSILYHLVGIQSPKELSERLNLTLIKATQLAIRLNNLKIGDKNDTGIKEPQA